MVATAPQAQERRQDQHWGAWFALLLAVLLLLRLVGLRANATDLFFDEAQYWAWGQEPAFGYYSKPPLIAWLIRAATEVCGAGEVCVRLPSPLLHTAAATAVFFLGARLYDARTGALAGIAFATLPGVSLSAGIISTDVPLLLFWALALLALVILLESLAWWPALFLGVAWGAGLNAKYAMAWFFLCLGVYLVAEPRARTLLRDARLYAAFLIAALLITPNIWWNAAHGFATFAHTADNAKWEGIPFHPLKMLEFLGSQFGVAGPVLFAAFALIAWRALFAPLPRNGRLLLSFSLPLILIISFQAFLSRAHANWAAPAYVAATLLTSAVLLHEGRWGWLWASFTVNVLAAAAIPAGTALAGRVALPVGADPFARTLGWKELAAATQSELRRARASGQPFATVLTDERRVTAELLYYMRGEPTPVAAWREGPRPRDHFELTRPYGAESGEPVLLVVLKDATAITNAFTSVRRIAVRDLPAGASEHRRVTFYALSGYHGP